MNKQNITFSVALWKSGTETLDSIRRFGSSRLCSVPENEILSKGTRALKGLPESSYQGAYEAWKSRR